METNNEYNIRILKELILPFKKEKWDLTNENMSIMSINLKVDRVTDKNNSWLYRRDSIVEMIKDKQPSIICCQETMPHMAKFLNAKIGCNYNCYGKEAFFGTNLVKSLLSNTLGNIIFYDKSKFDLISKETLWLSDKPNFPSKTWGNTEKRNCTIVQLKNKETNKVYTIINTHFDHLLKEARTKSTDFIINLINNKYNNTECYVLGDLNAKINDEELVKFKTFNYYPNESNNIKTTFNGFTKNKKSVIDYIITNSNETKNFDLITDGYGVQYLSDHYPITINL